MSDDEGKKMSLYGVTISNPQEDAGFWKNACWKQNDIRNKHLSVKGDGTKYWPGVQKWSRHDIDTMLAQGKRSLYGKRKTPSVVEAQPLYLRLHCTQGGFNSTIHRDDRQDVRYVGCSVTQEEKQRDYPVLTSTHYGRRQDDTKESFTRQHVKVERFKREFFNKNGTGLPPYAKRDLADF